MLSVAAGAAFIALDATITGIVIGYRRRMNSGREDAVTAAAERVLATPAAVVSETIVEEPDRAVLVQ